MQPTERILSHMCGENEMKIEQGKSYKRRDGEKVTQRSSEVFGKIWGWLGDDGVCRMCNGESIWPDGETDLIAEWTDEPAGKTLAELDVKPGDVVYFHKPGCDRGSPREIGVDKGRYQPDPFWHIVSRAEPDTPKTWGPWMLRNFSQSWDEVEFEQECQVVEDANGDVVAYRVAKPSPVRETVTVDLGVYKSVSGWKSHNSTNPYDDCSQKLSITFTTSDGNHIPGTYTNEAGDVITMTEIGDEG